MMDLSPLRESVRGERTADVLARRLSKAILDGDLAPGTRLREATLAATYDVSRTPIREALIALSTSGLVALERNRGATVLQRSSADVREIYHLRSVLEAEAASLAASRATPELLALLDASCDRLAELHDAPASEQLAADTTFHYAIAEASGSGRLSSCIRQISAIPEAYRSSFAYSGEDMTEAERQHRAVGSALRKHRRSEAARAMRSHVEWAGGLALSRLADRLPPT
jgi:DNA-binding GntR family transcriptional regulator